MYAKKYTNRNSNKLLTASGRLPTSNKSNFKFNQGQWRFIFMALCTLHRPQKKFTSFCGVDYYSDRVRSLASYGFSNLISNPSLSQN